MEEKKFNFSIIWFAAFVAAAIGLVLMSRYTIPKDCVTIHKYNEKVSRIAYMDAELAAKDLLIKDLIKGETDSLFFIKMTLYMTPVANIVNPDYEQITHEIDSLYANWIESIQYVGLDRRNDSLSIQQTESFKMAKLIIEELSNKYADNFIEHIPDK